MSFHVSLPIYDSDKKCHLLTIDDAPAFKGGTKAPYEIAFEGNVEFLGFVTEFLKQASPYFSKPLDNDVFIQRIRHSYSTGEEISNENLRGISWIPARVLFYPSRYEFQWVLGEIDREEPNVTPPEEPNVTPPEEPNVTTPEEPKVASPGTDLVEADISERPLTQSEQKRIRQKVRQARLKCALARLHLERLTERYYAKYGGFDGLDGSDSELSSEIEFRENEAPRKI
jgi:hypothetical protein